MLRPSSQTEASGAGKAPLSPGRGDCWGQGGREGRRQAGHGEGPPQVANPADDPLRKPSLNRAGAA